MEQRLYSQEIPEKGSSASIGAFTYRYNLSGFFWNLLCFVLVRTLFCYIFNSDHNLNYNLIVQYQALMIQILVRSHSKRLHYSLIYTVTTEILGSVYVNCQHRNFCNCEAQILDFKSRHNVDCNIEINILCYIRRFVTT